MQRRQFLQVMAALGGAVMASPLMNSVSSLAQQAGAQVAFVKTRNRADGVRKALQLLDTNVLESLKGKSIFLKPNFNSADPAPGSTHPDVLRTLIEVLQANGVEQITLGDRSGMGDTRQVMERLGVFELADELGVKTLVFDELDADAWTIFQPKDSHWKRGFALPKAVLSAGGVVQAACLKTHRFGGHFTLSLKNSVGLAAKVVPGDSYNYMSELHSSPHQRLMIAEINAAYKADLIVMDGVEAFTDGGPDRGSRVDAEVVLAGTDRVAVDAVSVAILRHLGTTPAVSRGLIFEQEQIARAAALGVGVDGPARITLVTGDDASAAYAAQISKVLAQG